ncbi:OmpA family protein [Glaciimonas sp. GNP009]
MRQVFALSLLIGATSHFAPTIAFAQSADIQVPPSGNAYLQDNRGPIARSQFGLCWRSGYWDDQAAMTGCDGQLAPPIMKATAPELIKLTTAEPTEPPIAPNQCKFSTILNGDQTFTFGKSTLKPAAGEQIDKDVLPQLRHCGIINAITITGHTDRLGTDNYNKQLSEQRAKSVANYLKNKGIVTRITIIGAGKSQAVTICSKKSSRSNLLKCLAPNRRVVIKVQ